MLATAAKAAVAAEYRMPCLFGAMAVASPTKFRPCVSGSRHLQRSHRLPELRSRQFQSACRWLPTPALAHQPSPAPGARGRGQQVQVVERVLGRVRKQGQVRHRLALPRCIGASALSVQFIVWLVAALAPTKMLLPNPSLEPTRSGMAPWPPSAVYHVALVGQGAMPPRSAQLKR